MSLGVPCIVLAGGLGTRLRDAVPDRPKCLAPVGDRSFLAILLDRLAASGIDRFVLSLGHMADQVVQAAKALPAHYRVELVIEPQPLGTGGATLHVFERLGLTEAMVANGDTYIDGDLAAIFEPLDMAGGEAMRLGAVNVDDRSRYGGLTTDGARVVGFVEKGHAGPGLINAGLYRLHRSAFGELREGEPFSLETQVMPALARRGALTHALLDARFIDIGVPDDYRRFCREHA